MFLKLKSDGGESFYESEIGSVEKLQKTSIFNICKFPNLFDRSLRRQVQRAKAQEHVHSGVLIFEGSFIIK